MNATKATLPDEVYALIWTSLYAGDVPGDSIVKASRDLETILADPRRGEETYDGVSMRSRGRFAARKFPKPASIATLEREFGDRVEFGPCQDGCNVGCWIDGKPHRLRDEGWAWDREEYDYLAVAFVADGRMDPGGP